MRRQRAQVVGRLAEWVAAASLVMRGYRIVERRYRVRSGEIDIIAVRGRLVSFVEVKMRQRQADAEVAVTDKGRRRCRSAARLWIARRPRYHDFDQRFDAVLVVPWQWPVHLHGFA
ncbi:MAG: YraN family protein [Hyphomicrobiaceae bacterium]|nr:YraN family protein [Hyphomicrobiaceae bacterium]